MSRRAFVGSGFVLAAGALGLAGVEGAVAFVGALAAPGPGLTRSRFAPLVGSRLVLGDGRRTAVVRLVRVDDLPRSRPANVEHQFSLLLESVAGLDWPQRTYDLRGPGLGRVSLFAVPTGAPSGRSHYEIVVNNPIEAAAV